MKLIYEDQPPIIITKPTNGPTLEFAIYCCLTFDPDNLIGWNEIATEFDMLTDTDSIIFHCSRERVSSHNTLTSYAFDEETRNQANYKMMNDEYRKKQVTVFRLGKADPDAKYTKDIEKHDKEFDKYIGIIIDENAKTRVTI